MENLNKLRVLNLGDNQVQEFPFLSSNITELSLRNNKIEVIPNNISKLKKLRRLDFRGNLIKELPKEILELKSLERLYLRWNENIAKPNWLDDLNPKILIYF